VLVHVQADGFAHDFEALLDTGFDGDIAVPGAVFGFGEAASFERWVLADGSIIHAPFVAGTANFGPFGPMLVAISVFGARALIGRGVADRFSVHLDHGTRIIVEP
jgi:hypothetical protein